ncbi:hypothetical protein TNCV_2681981 [Trichonephila clavipes]|nr:hypothetical protein TNCV_2681981 [Trichonephila clavipes]
MDEKGKYYIYGEEHETNKFSYDEPSLHSKTKQNFKEHNETSTEKDTVNTDVSNRCELKILNGHTGKSKSKRNLQIHAKERSYACEICNKSFNRKGNLKIHLRIHKNEKPYVCEICNKAHSKLNNLKKTFAYSH